MQNISQSNPTDLHICATGDISFEGIPFERPDPLVFSDVDRFMKGCDIGIANLENPLTKKCSRVPGKCTLRGDPGWAVILKKAGINLVSLANNHIMDYGAEGMLDTIHTLDSAGVMHLGAGMDIEEACAPLVVNIKGRDIAFLARSSVIVTSPSYARDDSPGVAFLDKDEIIRSIKECRDKADLVVVMIHWGLEEYHYPSPEQVDLARDMVDAGAGIILGHHPHVVQGGQWKNDSVVAYSLGNFLFNDLTWDWQDGVSGTKSMSLKLSEENRKGIILRISQGASNNISVSKLFTLIKPDGSVEFDKSPDRELEFLKLSRRIDHEPYRWWWKSYALHREWRLRIHPKLNIRKIFTKFWRIRPRHFKELINTMKKSENIASGKTTNPYE